MEIVVKSATGQEVKVSTHKEYLDHLQKSLEVMERMLAAPVAVPPDRSPELFLIDRKINNTNHLLVELLKHYLYESMLKLPAVGIVSLQKLVTSAGTAEQLPFVEIPYDREVTIKALPANTGTIYVGNSKPEAENTSVGFPLDAGDALELKIDNLSKLWIDASVSGEGVAWIVEK